MPCLWYYQSMLLICCSFRSIIKGRYLTNSSAQSADILLYTNSSRPKFVLLITGAAGIQLVFWCYLAYSALDDYYTATVKRNKEVESRPEKVEPGLLEVGPGIEERVWVLQSKSSLKWRVSFSLLALSVGAFFGVTALMYPRRMVNRLEFNRLNNLITISTHTPVGGIQHTQVYLQ